VPRPFLKWVGGKAQLLPELLSRLPDQFGCYHEPFVGGGALFFALYRRRLIGQAVLSDLNAELIDTFIAVRDCVEEVIALLETFPYDEAFYYSIRGLKPAELDLPHRAARMIYLNKTGYNGLYRVNKAGRFNVPFGRYKRPTYRDPENLRAVSMALQGVEILWAPFESVLERAERGDLVYFDPPYVPVSETANFTSYSALGFSLDDQRRLRDVALELTARGVWVMLSNSETEAVRELYSASSFVLSRVEANRHINSNPRRRGKVGEYIITNYERAVPRQPRLLEQPAFPA